MDLPNDWYIEPTGESLILDQRTVEAAIARLRTALRPFAAAVYNDNGNMTVTPCGREAYIAAFFAMRAVEQAPEKAT